MYTTQEERFFAGMKISRVRFLQDTEKIVTGSWDNPCNKIVLWSVIDDAKVRKIIKTSELILGEPEVSDIFVINASQFVVSLSNGDVKIIDRQEDTLVEIETFPKVHRKAASEAICVLNDEIYSGSDTGSIVRISPSAAINQSVSIMATDLMGVRCMTACGTFQFVSGHMTGQLHLWDVRQNPFSPANICKPIISKPVTALNNAITAVASHPAQPNLLAFGTHDGSVSFIDIRNTKEPPVAFKVSKGPINQLKFHPIYSNNCFSSSCNSVVHWDATVFSGQGPSIDGDNDDGHTNIWLSSRAWNNINLKALVEDDPCLISSFDITQNALVVGSNTFSLVYMDNLVLTN